MKFDAIKFLTIRGVAFLQWTIAGMVVEYWNIQWKGDFDQTQPTFKACLVKYYIDVLNIG